MNPEERIIVALDVDTAEEALKIAGSLGGRARIVKVGSRLFTREGPGIVKKLHELGKEVFLDLKFHDIPNTVAGSAEAAAALGVWMFNIHASGGGAMMKACADALSECPAVRGKRRPLVLGVTVLTSMDQNMLSHDIGVSRTVEDQVLHLAGLAQAFGLDGVVASPREIRPLREALGPGFIILTPGIRPSWASGNDQKRIMTPAEAFAAGADYLVIGRPVIRAEDPAEAFERIVEECIG